MIDLADLKARNAPLNAFVDWAENPQGGNGPLGGVTVGVKSNIAVAGLPWTGGMGTRRGVIAERDATVVARLRAAGAVILGSLNMHEGALGATSDNAFYGRTHNPHRIGLTPGGSSGGSGAAVAARLCDVALGTDTLGSVRIPAAYNGVYGLKPTYGLVPDDGLLFLEPQFDTIGPLARELDVLERVFGVMMGEEAGPRLGGRGDEGGDTASPPQAVTPDLIRGRAFPLARLLTLADLNGVACEPAVEAGYGRALAALDLPREELRLADDATAIRMAGFVASGQWLARELGEARHGDGVSDDLKFMLDLTTGMKLQPELLARTRTALLDAIGDDGVLVLPTAPQAPFPHGRPPATQADFTGLANIAGLPALACPAGRNEDGLPVSVQLVGPTETEGALIDLARRLEPALGGAVLPQ